MGGTFQAKPRDHDEVSPLREGGQLLVEHLIVEATCSGEMALKSPSTSSRLETFSLPSPQPATAFCGAFRVVRHICASRLMLDHLLEDRGHETRSSSLLRGRSLQLVIREGPA